MKAVILLLLLALVVQGAAPSVSDSAPWSSYLVQDSRKIDDLGKEEELWALTLKCVHESGSAEGAPEVVTMITRVRKPSRTSSYLGPLPVGTEFRVQLTHRSTGSWETVYYRNLAKPESLTGSNF